MPPKEPVAAVMAAPPLISLLTSAEIVPDKSRWEGGFAYEPEACGEDNMGILDPCQANQTKTVTLGTGYVEVEPFVIWTGDSCSSMGGGARDWKGRAQRKLDACQSNQIEEELWRGTLARERGWENKFLTRDDGIHSSDVVALDASPTQALACLEQALAECNCGQQGMIHATPQIITEWIALRLVTREGNRLLTYLGTVVVPGSGYDGSGPHPTTPVAPSSGRIWAYATGMVQIRLGPVSIVPGTESEAMNRSTNTITVRAERIAAYSWDCCFFSARIDSDLCIIGGS